MHIEVSISNNDTCDGYRAIQRISWRGLLGGPLLSKLANESKFRATVVFTKLETTLQTMRLLKWMKCDRPDLSFSIKQFSTI